MTILHLVRHGETDWNRQGRFQGTRDIPLNDEGRRQARRLAEAWDAGGEVLISSPLSRARETAEILGRSQGLRDLSLEPLLVERHYGLGEGLTKEERADRFPDGRVPGVEEPESIQARARRFLDTLAQAHAGRRVVAVSHGGFINVVLSVVSGGEVGTGKTFLGNASVSTVARGESGWSVVEVGKVFEPASLGLRE
jgi:broad specificity phosphatase PhoE